MDQEQGAPYIQKQSEIVLRVSKIPEKQKNAIIDDRINMAGDMQMAERTRTIKWCETRILKELSKRPTITTSLALSAIVLRNGSSLEEDQNLDLAV